MVVWKIEMQNISTLNIVSSYGATVKNSYEPVMQTRKIVTSHHPATESLLLIIMKNFIHHINGIVYSLLLERLVFIF